MSPETYAHHFAAIAAIGDVDPTLSTPAEYVAAGPAERIASAAALGVVAAATLDRLRAVAAVSEWAAELYVRTVSEAEAILTASPAP